MTSTRATATRTAARLLLAGGAVATLALVAGPAVASPAARPAAVATTPGPTTVAAIMTAIQDSPATAGVPRDGYAVTDVRTAGPGAGWAGVSLQPTGDDLDPATAVLRRLHGAWTVVDLGTAQVGCGTAPAAVVTALGLGC